MTLTVKFPNANKKKRLLRKQLSAIHLTFDDAEDRLRQAWPVTKDMLDAGFRAIDNIMDLPRDERVRAFNEDRDLERWFGKIKNAKQAKTIHNRLDGIRRRHQKNVTIAVRPDRIVDDKRESPSAITGGASNLNKTRMRVYTHLIKKNIYELAETLVHELGHNWFTDQKLGKVKVYGESRARDLATYNPRKARRSTENYAIFCTKQYFAEGVHTETENGFSRILTRPLGA